MKKRLLVVTSGYQRWQNDIQYDHDFITVLTQGLSKNYDITVLAPRFPGSLKEEWIEGVRICRHRQFFTSNVGLAYGSGILPNMKRNKLLLFVLPFYLIFFLIALFRILFIEKFTLVHAHWIVPQGFFVAIYKLLFNRKIRLLVTSHGGDTLGNSYSLSGFIRDIPTRFTLKYCNAVTAVSIPIKDILKNLGYNGQTHVYPMGVDTDHFVPMKQRAKTSAKINQGAKIIIFTGSIIARKGVPELIKAMKIVCRTLPDVTLLMIGEGNLKESLQKEVSLSGLAENIIFTGYVSHAKLPQYYRSSDLFVFPSKSEGFGLVLAEAMSSGVPVLASNLPAFHDFIEDGKTGFFMKSLHPADIAQDILTLLNSENDVQTVLESARESIIKRYGWNTVIQKYDCLINDL